jgi:hypothetical protein
MAPRLAGKVVFVNIGFDGPRSTFSRVHGDYGKAMTGSGRSGRPGCRSRCRRSCSDPPSMPCRTCTRSRTCWTPTAATGLLAECDDGCTQDPGHAGLCLRASPDECQWCGTPGRLREASPTDIGHLLPTVGEEHEGQWFLHFADGQRGPYPSARAAWDDWHTSPGPRSDRTTLRAAPARHGPGPANPDRSPGRSRTGHDRP